MGRVTFQGSEVGGEDVPHVCQTVKITGVVSRGLERVLEKNYVLLKHRTKEVFVVVGFVGAGGKSIRRVEEVASGAQDLTGTITTPAVIFVVDTRIVLTIKAQEKVLAISGNAQER